MKIETKTIRFFTYEIDFLHEAIITSINDGWKPLGSPFTVNSTNGQMIVLIFTRELEAGDPARIVPRVY